jgi:hypothetical protein
MRLFLCLLVAIPLISALPSPAVGADVYDVSYVWGRSASSVLDYRDKVGGVLGPDVAKDLQVVARDELFGLIYRRAGDSKGATRVARVHTRLLQSQGLDAAAPIRSGDWTLIDGDPTPGEQAVASSTSVPDDSPEAGVVRRPSPQNAGATIWVMVDGVLEPVVLSEQSEEMALPDSGLPQWLQAAISIFQRDAPSTNEGSCASSRQHTC